MMLSSSYYSIAAILIILCIGGIGNERASHSIIIARHVKLIRRDTPYQVLVVLIAPNRNYSSAGFYDFRRAATELLLRSG
jgi:hypothetical protein